MYRLDSPMLSAVLFALSLSLSVFAVHRSAHESVVTVNKRKIVTQFAKEMHARALPKSTEKQLSRRFAKALKTSIDNYARGKQLVVLDSKAVLGSGVDVSDSIMSDVVVLMRGNR